jgi:hypothetical protein
MREKIGETFVVQKVTGKERARARERERVNRRGIRGARGCWDVVGAGGEACGGTQLVCVCKVKMFSWLDALLSTFDQRQCLP